MTAFSRKGRLLAAVALVGALAFLPSGPSRAQQPQSKPGVAQAAPQSKQTQPPQQTMSRDDIAFMAGIIQLVQQAYVHPIGSAELTKDALKGMLARLDPHSDYMDEQEFKDIRSDLSGEFGGLGLQISSQNGVPKVIAPIEGTPAARAGVEPGDLIVAIEKKSTRGVTLNKVVQNLRGKPGTKVAITLLRGDSTLDLTITRDIITVDTVKSKMVGDQVGYIRITQFGEKTSADFAKAVGTLKDQAKGDLKGMIVDVRNDPGGLLNAAVSVAGNFLDGGKVVSIRGRRTSDEQAFNASGRDRIPNVPMVVLINAASASASEIVAGALQDRKRATVMGTQSFGKGSVQSVIPLQGYGALRLTTALYYTPNGRSIQSQGIVPDVVVDLPKEQQISGGAMLRESALAGAIRNPGALGKTEADKNEMTPEVEEKPVSGPIKIDLIATENDAQLKAALNYLAERRRADNKTPDGNKTP